MNYIQKVTKIRERGQLTVPQEIREILGWPEEELVVRVETISDGFKVERLSVSHPEHPKRKLTNQEWDQIWRDLKRFSQTGKKKINLSKFIRHDRDTR